MYQMHLTKNYTLDFYHVDFEGKASLAGFLKILVQIAWEHAQELDLGFSDMAEQQLVWVMTRLKVEVLHYPHWQDEIRVKTWAADKDNLYWHRDFKIYDAEGNVIAKAASVSVLINLKTRRPCRADKLFNEVIDPDERAFDENLRKLPKMKEAPLIQKIRAGYSDLDINKHVNTVRFIEWVLDSYALEQFETKQVCSLEANFLSEGQYGDEVVHFGLTGGDMHMHSLKKQDDKELFRMQIGWVGKGVPIYST